MNSVLYHYAALFFIIPLILGTVVILKRRVFLKAQDSSSIKLINQISIGTKERIALLEYNEAKILVGITANQISTLYVDRQDDSKQ